MRTSAKGHSVIDKCAHVVCFHTLRSPPLDRDYHILYRYSEKPMSDSEDQPTDAQLRFIRCVAKLTDKRGGRGPSLKEIAAALKYTHMSGAQQMMLTCASKGWIRPARVIPPTLTEKGKKWL